MDKRHLATARAFFANFELGQGEAAGPIDSAICRAVGCPEPRGHFPVKLPDFDALTGEDQTILLQRHLAILGPVKPAHADDRNNARRYLASLNY